MEITKVLGTVAMVPKGEYDAEEYYEYLNVVTYNGSSYMARKSSHGVLPTNDEYWQLVAQKAARTYQSVADMKSDDDLKEGMVTETLGYYEANDGGAATYKVRSKEASDVDNGGSLIVLNDYFVAEMIVDGEVNVLTWGVKRKNAASQTNINKLLSYYSSGNISIYFPAGEYYLTETIYLPTKTRIRGDGGATTLSWYGSSNTYMICIPKGRLYCMLHDLCFDGRSLAYGIYDNEPSGSGSNGVRSKIFNLVMNNMKIGIRMAAMGSEFHNILCNGSRQYNDDTTIGFYITGTDNFVNSCRVQTFGVGMHITGSNNRLFTIKTCVNGTGTIIENCTSGFYNIDLQENYKDNLLLNNISESQFIISNQNAGIDDHYLNGTDLQYSLIKMTNCKSTTINGTLGARTKLGSGSCGNEKYALYIDKKCTNITGNFTYRFVLSNETIKLDKPLFYCVETETNKITVNNEQLNGQATFSNASITNVLVSGAVQSISYTDNVITQSFKTTTVIDNISNPPNSAMFSLANMNEPMIIEMKSDTLYFVRGAIQFASITKNKYYSVTYGMDWSSIATKDGSILKIFFDGLDAIYNEHLSEIEEYLGGEVERVLLMVAANATQYNDNKITIRVGTYSN